MLDNLMMIKFTLQRTGTCVKFQPTEKMLQLFNVTMYDFKNPIEDEIINQDVQASCQAFEDLPCLE